MATNLLIDELLTFRLYKCLNFEKAEPSSAVTGGRNYSLVSGLTRQLSNQIDNISTSATQAQFMFKTLLQLVQQ